MTEIFGGTPQFYSWYANRTLHCMLIMQPCQKSTSKLFGKKKKITPPNEFAIYSRCYPRNINLSKKKTQLLSPAAQSQRSTFHQITFFISPRFYLATIPHSPEGRAGTV